MAAAKTPEEIGLPPQFRQAMTRRLGQTGIFVNAGGDRYYLDEARLAQFNNTQAGFGWQGGAGQMRQQNRNARSAVITLRIARISIAIVIALLVLSNLLYFHSPDVWIAVVILLFAEIIIFVMMISYLARIRRTYRNYP